MEKIRTAVIGAGMMGFSQIRNCFLPMEEYDLVAVCDVYEPNRSRVAEYLKSIGKVAAVYENYQELLEKESFELAVIVVPDYLHEEVAIACLEAGKHLRLEKPMATTMEGCKRIMEAYEKHPQIVQIGYELRYANIVCKMREWLPQIGQPKMMWCHEFRHPFLPKEGLVPNWIIQKKYSGGTLLEKNCHHFDLFNMIAGCKPVSVYASGDNQVIYQDTDVLDHGFAVVEYENHMRAMLSVCLFAPELKQQKHMHAFEFGVLGKNGRIDIKDDTLYLWDREGKGELEYRYLRNNFEAHTEDIIPSLKELARCIRQGEAPYTDIHTGFDSAMLALAAEKSAETKQIIFLETGV